MYFSKVIYVVGVLSTFGRVSEANLAGTISQVSRQVPDGVQKLYSYFKSRGFQLRQSTTEDSLLVEAGTEYIAIVDTPILGVVTWSDFLIHGLSEINATDVVYACSNAPKSTLLTWSVDIPSVSAYIPSFDLNFGYFSSEFKINLIKLSAKNLQAEVNSVAVSAKAEGTCNDQEVIISDLTLNIGLKFETLGDGDVMLNRDGVSLIYIRDSLNNLFNEIWNTRTQPMYQNYLKCAINIALVGCTGDTMDTCVQEPGLNNQKCKDELNDL